MAGATAPPHGSSVAVTPLGATAVAVAAVVTAAVVAETASRRMRRLWLALPLLAAVLGTCAFRPVCVPIPADTLAQFDPPIELRDDRDFYLKVFQQRDGEWQQCKTWLSRKLFF
jgi:hypothetical protein